MAMLEAINSTEYGTVERVASNIDIAFEWLKQCSVDVVLLDIAIIRSKGFEPIKVLKDNFPGVEVIMLSNNDPDSPEITLEALRTGAMDFIQKPPEKELAGHRAEFVSHFDTLFSQIILKKFSGVSEAQPARQKEAEDISKGGLQNAEIRGHVDLVLIASSTGGPVALDAVFSALSLDISVPILVVQHMPPGFTNLMAQAFRKKYGANTMEARENDIVNAGKILIAPGGRHMSLECSEGSGRVHGSAHCSHRQQIGQRQGEVEEGSRRHCVTSPSFPNGVTDER
jgi:two-component system chemotaxis response regulator CheB